MQKIKLFSLIVSALVVVMCVPPAENSNQSASDKKRLDSLRNRNCPRKMSSAAENYNNGNWFSLVLEIGYLYHAGL